MSGHEILLWTSLRTGVIAFFALIIAYFCATFFRSKFQYKSFAWIVLLAPVVVPPLALGYIYSGPILSFIQNHYLNNVLYSVIMITRNAPFATLLLFLFPLQSRESNYLFHFTQQRQNRLFPWIHRLRSDKLSLLAAFSILFILTFNEFEIASLMGIKHWSVSLFDSQVQGVSIWNLIVQSCYPVLIILSGLLLFLFSIKQPFIHRHSDSEYVATKQNYYQ